MTEHFRNLGSSKATLVISKRIGLHAFSSYLYNWFLESRMKSGTTRYVSLSQLIIDWYTCKPQVCKKVRSVNYVQANMKREKEQTRKSVLKQGI